MKTEVLIIGQGISGTWLSYYLEKNKVDHFVIDQADSQSASRQAGGLINPVTGRNKVKTWLAEHVVALWTPEIKVFEANQWTTFQSQDLRYVGTPAMNTPAKQLAKGLVLHARAAVAWMLAVRWQVGATLVWVSA